MNAYEGSEKYIFVSYAHKDSAVVLPILNTLQEHGCRIWCDEKLIVGENYNAAIARHLRNCDAVLFFLSKNWMASKYCRNEAAAAIEQFDKKVALLYLESCAVHDEVLMLFIGKHAVRRNDPAYLDKLLQSPALRDCIGQAEAVQEASNEPSDDRMQQRLTLADTSEGHKPLTEQFPSRETATSEPSSSSPQAQEKRSELEFKATKNPNEYTVMGIGTLEGSDIIIPSTYEGKNVTSIENRAFYKCSTIKSIQIPKTVTEIGWDAFSYCTALTDISVPDSVTSIEKSAFHDCSSLKSIRIPKSIRVIDQTTFSNCTALQRVTIPKSVSQIEWWAFYNCKSLSEIQYSGTKQDWKKIRFNAKWNSKCSWITVRCTDGNLKLLPKL